MFKQFEEVIMHQYTSNV